MWICNSILLFGTLGARDKGEYYESIKKKIEAIVPESNKMLGHFLCQGKIDERLTEKYNEMIKESPNAEHIKEQLKNHYEAASHPDLNDLQMAKDFICNIFV